MPSAFWPALLLAVISVCAKISLATPDGTSSSFGKLLVITTSDLVFATAYGLVSWGLLRLSRNSVRWRRVSWIAIIVCGALFGFYAVANAGIVKALGFPLNARMFGLVKRFTDLRSSIVAHTNLLLVLGMVAAVLAYVALGRWGSQLRINRLWRAVLLLVGAAWVASGSTLRGQYEPGSWARNIGRNPHWEMLGSLVSLANSQRLEVVGPFPAEYARDFAPAIDFERPALPQYSPPPKNVIFVVLESVSAQYMSVYEAKYDTTPNLAAELKNSLVVDRCYANAGYTYRSVVPIMYGVHPGLPWGWLPNEHMRMPLGMAGMLKPRGYRTALFAAGNPEWGGMDWISQAAGGDEVFGPFQLEGPQASSWGTEDGVAINGLLKWIDAKPGQPFYAIVWTDQTHDPYTLEKGNTVRQFVDPKSMRRGDWFNRYLTALHQVDRHLGRMFAELRKRGIADDTLVVITGDHGEAFGWPHESTGHGGTLFDEAMRVPLIFWNPRLFAGGQRLEKTGSHVDINPTMAHLMNVEPHPQWQGASLFSPQHPGRAYMAIDLSGFVFGVCDGRWKYMLHATQGFEQMYDLASDPLELREISSQHSERVKEFRQRISAFVKSEEDYLKRNGVKP